MVGCSGRVSASRGVIRISDTVPRQVLSGTDENSFHPEKVGIRTEGISSAHGSLEKQAVLMAFFPETVRVVTITLSCSVIDRLLKLCGISFGLENRCVPGDTRRAVGIWRSLSWTPMSDGLLMMIVGTCFFTRYSLLVVFLGNSTDRFALNLPVRRSLPVSFLLSLNR